MFPSKSQSERLRPCVPHPAGIPIPPKSVLGLVCNPSRIFFFFSFEAKTSAPESLLKLNSHCIGDLRIRWDVCHLTHSEPLCPSIHPFSHPWAACVVPGMLQAPRWRGPGASLRVYEALTADTVGKSAFHSLAHFILSETWGLPDR